RTRTAAAGEPSPRAACCRAWTRWACSPPYWSLVCSGVISVNCYAERPLVYILQTGHGSATAPHRQYTSQTRLASEGTAMGSHTGGGGSRVLLLPYPSQGHVHPMLQFAKI